MCSPLACAALGSRSWASRQLSDQFVVQGSDERPKLALPALVVLLPLTENTIQTAQQPCSFEMPKLQLRLVVPDPKTLSDLPRVEDIAARSYGICRFEAISAAEQRLRDCPDRFGCCSVRAW